MVHLENSSSKGYQIYPCSQKSYNPIEEIKQCTQLTVMQIEYGKYNNRVQNTMGGDKRSLF